MVKRPTMTDLAKAAGVITFTAKNLDRMIAVLGRLVSE